MRPGGEPVVVCDTCGTTAPPMAAIAEGWRLLLLTDADPGTSDPKDWFLPAEAATRPVIRCPLCVAGSIAAALLAEGRAIDDQPHLLHAFNYYRAALVRKEQGDS